MLGVELRSNQSFPLRRDLCVVIIIQVVFHNKDNLFVDFLVLLRSPFHLTSYLRFFIQSFRCVGSGWLFSPIESSSSEIVTATKISYLIHCDLKGLSEK